ncbi:MAG: class I SAM-dependent methyltransferase [Dysgonamonadaceae bacterium]|jgi:predicted O-methyltransferase YrrM|nr:class I SAM-dependent methyltransferase [Dysgonamonadaceae bacterium]
MSEIEEYILQHIDAEPVQLAELYRTANIRLLNPRMLAGHLQGRILKMLVRMFRPARILEIGTFTGYAALCMAEGLAEGGQIDTIESDDEMEDFIREQFARSPFGGKIRLHIGDAVKVIPALEGKFDMVYIDGDKREYCAYYEAVFERVRRGGVILADNTLWGGKVMEKPHSGDRHTQEIVRFNEMLAKDRRIEKVILPLRDGLTVIYKL